MRLWDHIICDQTWEATHNAPTDLTYLLFCMCYTKSVSFIHFLMKCCIYNGSFITIVNEDKTLLHLKSQR